MSTVLDTAKIRNDGFAPSLCGYHNHIARLSSSIERAIEAGWTDEEGHIPKRLDRLAEFLTLLISEILEPSNLADPQVHPHDEEQISVNWRDARGVSSVYVNLDSFTGRTFLWSPNGDWESESIDLNSESFGWEEFRNILSERCGASFERGN